MWQHFILAISMLLFCSWFSFGQEISYTTDSLDTIKQKVESSEAILLDVREQDEWDAGHARLAVLLPMSVLKDAAKRDQALKQLDKSKPIVTVCDAGISSTRAVNQLRTAGFESAYGLKGGMNNWSQAGMPVVSGKKTKPKKNKNKNKSKK